MRRNRRLIGNGKCGALAAAGLSVAASVMLLPNARLAVTRAQQPVSGTSAAGAVTYTLAHTWALTTASDHYPLTPLCKTGYQSFDSVGIVGIAFDATGRLLVANRCQYLFEGQPSGGFFLEVAKIDVATGAITTTNTGANPRPGIAGSPDGERIAVVEDSRISEAGIGAILGILRSWPLLLGRFGTDPEPLALAYGPDDVVFAYAETGVSRYGPLGQRRAPWEARIDPVTTLRPGSLFVDTVGDVYLTAGDYGGGVYKFSADGYHYEQWKLSEYGTLTGVTGFPGTDNAYVLDIGGLGTPARVLAFDSYGDVQRVLPVPNILLWGGWPPPRLAVGPDGSYALYGATQVDRDAAFMYDSMGTLLRVIFTRVHRYDQGGLGLEAALAAGPAGRTAVMRPFPAEVEIFDDAGVRLSQWLTPINTLDIAMDEDGGVILRRGGEENFGTRIGRYDQDGRLDWEHLFRFRAGSGLSAAGDQVYAPEPFAWAVSVLDRLTGDLVGRLTTAGRRGLFLPYDVDAGPDGVVVMLDSDLEQWQLWDLDTSVIDPISRLSLSTLTDEIAYTAPAVGTDARIAVIEGRFRSFYETRWPSDAISSAVAVFDGTGQLLWRADLETLGLGDYLPIDLDLDDHNGIHVLMQRRSDASPQFIAAVFQSTANAPGESRWPTPAPLPTPQAANTGPCRVEGNKWASPNEIWLGESVTVTLTLRRACPETPPRPADIILVVDSSGSMSGSPARAEGNAVKAFIAGLDLTIHRVGIVTFADSARLRVSLTNDPQTLAAIPDDWGADGSTNMNAGMNTAISALSGARPEAIPAIVFMSDGGFNVGGSPVGNAARARERGIGVFTVGLGSAVDVRTLIEMAGDLSRFYSALTESELITIYRQIAGAITSLSGGVSLDDTLHPDVRLVGGSVSPLPLTMTGPDIRWTWSQIGEEWITTTYRVRPMRTGIVPTNSEAFLDYVDLDEVTRRFVYPVPTVLVKALVTPTASPTASPEPVAIYLPINLSEVRCKPSEQPVDVALVIDASTSMLEQSSGQLRKIDAARAAASEFLAQLRLDAGDQASIISFNSDAIRQQPLGASLSQLRAGLDAIQVAPQTCIVCGVDAAFQELTSERHIGRNRAAMIVLSDGRSNPNPVADAVAVAARAKAAGIVIFTVGLGSDLDVEALGEMASRPGYFYQAPNAEELLAIYAEIAIEIPCPAGHFWGQG